jgi:hypothetical protein
VGVETGLFSRTSVSSHGHLNVSLAQNIKEGICSVAACESLKCHKTPAFHAVFTR